jgi:3'(2'), 5'-bisphosphate nucleotidase
MTVTSAGHEGDEHLLARLTGIVMQAARAVLAGDPHTVARRNKADGSLVTAADCAAEAIILEGLAAVAASIPVISEERAMPADARAATRVFFVDPLDGTREYVNGSAEYTVNVALIADGRPVLGVVAAPAQGVLWRGRVGHGAERIPCDRAFAATGQPSPVAVRKCDPTNLTALVSRSHLDARTTDFLTRFPDVRTLPCGSALKFCRLAEGAADLYPRLAPTHLWDVAAGHAVLAAAGGDVTQPDGRPLAYDAASGTLIPAFIAWGDRTLMGAWAT